ncbi:uroporphyrinogen-III C-methyltransferase [Labedella gwakjiensis]|uniref:uroporphyrinogen-III C-methyltransferase n=1 Tax=Labedella gwakjiensis TaxID=390269 RepID=A0A2P8GUT5_9MICO|nr:uroporphyrinogen-III C-methyltransferase [Labedella gwakjiensis]PSL37732.1 uroporphyrinogen-III C-methyltransferase [Labedella gwakjiensis]RUQ87678.1 uroporphyrinogen-III C-methyltransferase [Labedella gwakjiensis]
MSALLSLAVSGRRVVFVGGGRVSARRARSYVDEGADVIVVAPVVDVELRALIDGGLVTWIDGFVSPTHLDGAWIVHTATGDPAVDLLVASWADERRIWCINAGSGTDGSARSVATARAGEVTVGVSSAHGSDPRRTRAICDALADHVSTGGVDLRRVRRGSAADGRVVLVGGGPGDPDLLTVRARMALAQADVVVADRLGPRTVLDDLAPGVEIIDVGKTPHHHPVPQEEINRILVDRASRGDVVVRLKGGDPFVFGRGGEEFVACREAGIRVEVVPGISSALAVPAAAGIPVTHRGVARGFLTVTGHEAVDDDALALMRGGRTTVVVLMGVAALPLIVERALASGVDEALPVAIVENGTTAEQRSTRAPLSAIVGAATRVGVRNPAVIVFGEVARFGLLDPILAPAHLSAIPAAREAEDTRR